MRDADDEELAILKDIKKGLMAAKQGLTKLKAIALAKGDHDALIAAQGVHADIDKAHADAAKAALSVYANSAPIIMGPGR